MVLVCHPSPEEILKIPFLLFIEPWSSSASTIVVYIGRVSRGRVDH